MKKIFLLLTLLAVSALGAGDSFYIKTQSEVTVSSSQLVLANNLGRTYLLILNKGTSSVLLKCSSTFSASEGIIIPAGGNYEPLKAPLCDLWMKSLSGSNVVSILEGVQP